MDGVWILKVKIMLLQHDLVLYEACNVRNGFHKTCAYDDGDLDNALNSADMPCWYFSWH